ncbi:MAG: RibD family protein [Cyanobacteria bacterium P01_H01_bin.74]
MKIIACLASTLDGKIASHHEPEKRFGSTSDLTHLLSVRNQADAILVGGETFRQYSRLRVGSLENRPVPVQCILSKRLHLSPRAGLFQSSDAAGKTVIFTPTLPNETIKALYPEHLCWEKIEEEDAVVQIADYLKQQGIQTLLVEGGGMVLAQFLKAKLLDELYLTVCPLFLGGNNDPGLVAFEGFLVNQAPRTEIISKHWIASELYLHLKLVYDDSAR